MSQGFPPEYQIEFDDATAVVTCEHSLNAALLQAEKRQQQLQRSTKVHRVFTRKDNFEPWQPISQPE